MKLQRVLLGAAFAGAAAMSGQASAAFDLNNCNGSGLACPFVVYGDAQSYSLSLNMYIYQQATGVNGTQNPFYVNSSPGQISSLIVNATGPNGQQLVTNFAGMDNAYPTPDGTGGAAFFTMNKTAYATNNLNQNITTLGNVLAPADPIPNPSGPGDTPDTWDTTVAALKSFLGAGQTPIFFFNNNQTNSGSTIDQDVAVWARITLTSPTAPTLVFDFTNRGCAYAEVLPTDTNTGTGGFACANRFPPAATVGQYTSTGSQPVAGTNNQVVVNGVGGTDYVLAGGRLCIVPGVPYPGLIPTLPDGSCPAGTITINNNLGANQAAYAEIFPELNAALLSGAYDNGTMSVDLRFGCDVNTVGNTVAFDNQNNPSLAPGANCVGRSANNGYEQLFIASALSVPLPEPGTLALIGSTLLGLALTRRKRH